MSTNAVHARPRVFKFGGSSLGHAERFAHVVELVERERRYGAIAIVVSAFGDTTDDLLAAAASAGRKDLATALARVARLEGVALDVGRGVLAARNLSNVGDDVATVVAREIAPLRPLLEDIARAGECSPATLDRVLAFGELLSSAVVASALRAAGVAAERVDARTWVVTDDRHGNATVDMDATRAAVAAKRAEWLGIDEKTSLTVHTGFLGANPKGATTTLGRNGSDYTAALLASAIGAGEVTIWTDVSGVMTADPTIVSEAYPVPHLSYREALELAGLGLRMLHPRTVLPLLEAGIPLRIRNTMLPDEPGTVVDRDGSSDERRPTCVASLDDMTLVDVEGTLRTSSARIASRMLAALAAAAVDVWFSTPATLGNGLAFVIRMGDVEAARRAIDEELADELKRGEISLLHVVGPVAVVTLVAEAMGRQANVAGRFFGAVGAVGINVRAASQGASSRAISCVVDAADTAGAVQAVHAAFNLATEQVNVLLLGKGTVGGNLLDQIVAERRKLHERHDVDLRLVGIVDSRASVFDEASIDPREAREKLRASTDAVDIDALLDRLARLSVPVLVDCTAADDTHLIYEKALARGIHVVTANKKPLALPTAERDALFAHARHAHRAFRYETTVGASLPVIETLQNLVRTGDRVALVEGSLSGTLGYLSNELSRGVRLSVAVRTARERGYTEPHPRDDLSGTDAARKALILARELGMQLDLTDVLVEPFVPAELFAHDDVETFLAAVASYDDAFEKRVAGLRAEGQVLRYLATISPASEKAPAVVRVGPLAVPQDHPAARLRGTEALVAFRTERYSDYPLVVQGAGAGGAVTAAGVLADVLTICRARRGR